MYSNEEGYTAGTEWIVKAIQKKNFKKCCGKANKIKIITSTFISSKMDQIGA